MAARRRAGFPLPRRCTRYGRLTSSGAPAIASGHGEMASARLASESMTIASDDPRLQDRDRIAALLGEAARLTAAVLLAKRSARDVKLKADGSPVCSADLAADFAAKQALAELL